MWHLRTGYLNGFIHVIQTVSNALISVRHFGMSSSKHTLLLMIPYSIHCGNPFHHRVPFDMYGLYPTLGVPEDLEQAMQPMDVDREMMALLLNMTLEMVDNPDIPIKDAVDFFRLSQSEYFEELLKEGINKSRLVGDWSGPLPLVINQGKDGQRLQRFDVRSSPAQTFPPVSVLA